MEYFREHISEVTLFLGLAMLISILLRRSFRYFRRPSSKDASPIVKAIRPKNLHSNSPAEQNIERRQVEIHDTVRSLKAELDSKMGAIQHLTRLASEQAARLEAAIERAENLSLPDPKGISHRIDDNSLKVPPSPHEQPETNYFRETIVAFSEQGYSPEQIAHQVDLSVAEVLTILASSEDDFTAS